MSFIRALLVWLTLAAICCDASIARYHDGDCPIDGFDIPVDFDEQKRNSENNSQTLQRLLDCPNISTIEFTSGATYDMDDIVRVTSRASNKTLIGNGAILVRRQMRIFSFFGAPHTSDSEASRLRNFEISGFIFDYVSKTKNFESIIQFVTGEFEDIRIENNLFIQSDFDPNPMIENERDSWMVNLAPKIGRFGNHAVESRMENIYVRDNVCIAREIGFTAGGSDGLYKNVYIENNEVIRSEIAIDCTVNAFEGGRYENVNIARNVIVNPAEIGIHMGLDSDGLQLDGDIRSLVIGAELIEDNGLRIEENVISYGSRNEEKSVSAIIFRPGTDGEPKRDIVIRNNDWSVVPSVDNQTFSFQHIGTKIIRENFLDEVDAPCIYTAQTLHRNSGGESNYRLDLTIGQYPPADTIPIPPVGLEIADNTGSFFSRIKFRGLNKGNLDLAPNCSPNDYTTVTGTSEELIQVTIANFQPRVYQLSSKRRYPVLSEAIDIDSDDGFSLSFKFYSSSFCGEKMLFWQDDDNYIRFDRRPDFLGGPSERSGTLKVRLDGNDLVGLTGHPADSPFKEHTSYQVSIVAASGSVVTTVGEVFGARPDFVSQPVSDFGPSGSLHLSLKSIGAAVKQIASAHENSNRAIDGYIWDIGIESNGRRVAYFPGFSPSRNDSESWGNTILSTNDAILMALNTFDFDTTRHVQLSDPIEIPYEEMDLRFKIHPRANDNRVVFYGSTTHMMRLESTGRLKIRNNFGAPAWKTVAENLKLGNTYDIQITGARNSDSYVLTAFVNGETNKVTPFGVDPNNPKNNLFRFDRIGGPSKTLGFAKPFDGTIWDVQIGDDHEYLAAGDTAREAWQDQQGRTHGSVIVSELK